MALGGGKVSVTVEPLGSEGADPHAARSRKSGGTRRDMNAASRPTYLQSAKRGGTPSYSGETGVGQIAERSADGLSWLQTSSMARSEAWSSPWSGSTGRFTCPGGVPCPGGDIIACRAVRSFSAGCELAAGGAAAAAVVMATEEMRIIERARMDCSLGPTFEAGRSIGLPKVRPIIIDPWNRGRLGPLSMSRSTEMLERN
jgi:hypothetical protein